MKYYPYLTEYKREKWILSACFSFLLLAIAGIFILQNPQELLLNAVQAIENPTEVFAAVIKGAAYR